VVHVVPELVRDDHRNLLVVSSRAARRTR
jgi:hypothetical protein